MPADAATTVALEPLLLSRDQAARVLGGIDVSTLDRLQRSGAIGPRPISLGGRGGRLLYRRDELEAWVTAGCPDRVRWDHLIDQQSDRPLEDQPDTKRKGRRNRHLKNKDAGASPRLAV